MIRNPRIHLLLRAFLLAAALLVAPAAPAQISKYLRTTNFSYFEYHDAPARATGPRTNRLKSQLTGSEGQYLSNDLVRVTTARFEHYAPDGRGTNLVALAPLCLLDRGARQLSSTNALRIFANDGQLYIEGNSGFLYQMTNATFHVSNRVRTVLQQSLMQPVARSRP
jgi:hypothetical protein